MSAFNTPASTCLRVNTISTDRDKVSAHLDDANIIHTLGEISPHSLSIPKRYKLTELAAYKQGEFEIQDEASQLVAFCINPENKAKTLDACAGAGGKSLHIANLQKDCGKIVASDVEFMRLKEVGKRAKLAGLNSIETALVTNDFKLKKRKYEQKTNDLFDYVLVDAPCTGSGTVRREPMKKYRITKKVVAKMAKKQLEILSNFAKKVKVGGFLIYSTCSVFSEENEQVIQKFLAENQDFQPEPIKQHFNEHNVTLPNLSDDDFFITLFPFFHKTDGFFISKMKRNY